MTNKIINFYEEREKILKEKMKKAMEERGIKLGTIYACKIDEVDDYDQQETNR